MTTLRLRRCAIAVLSVALFGCEPSAGGSDEHSSESPAAYEAATSPLEGEGPVVRITVPTQNTSIDLAGPGPTVVTVRYEFLPAPDDETGGLQYVFDDGEPVALDDLGGSFSLTVDVGLHALTLLVTDDEGQAYDAPAAQTTHVFKVTAPCTSVADCVDDNPCSADFCFVVGLELRCQYGVDPSHPSCCLNRFDCPGDEMCVDLFPIGQPDGYRECVECDGTPDNCPPRACHDARCHDLSFQCVYDRRDDGCCVPGENECPNGPCEGCVSADGFEGTCGPLGPPGSCCFQFDGAPGPPAYGCETGDPCAVAECVANVCRFGEVSAGCCTEDADCVDPLQVNGCTGATGVCEDIAGDPATGRCAYPQIVPDCCVLDGDCFDRFPLEVGRCQRPAPDAPGECVYEANPGFCEWDGPPVVISEFLIESDVGFAGEWFELFNTTGQEIDLLGWHIENGAVVGDSLYIVGDAAVILPPGGHFVIGRTDDPDQSGGVPVDYVGFGLSLDATSGALRLVDREDREVDFVFWDERFPVVPGRSTSRTSPYRPGDAPEAWRAGTALYGAGGRGTPGRSNVDAYDAGWSPPICDDADPCTLDLCHGTLANVCAHRRMAECCAAPDDEACDDDDLCTIDSCTTAAFTCEHVFDSGRCCQTDGECPPGPAGLPLQEEVLYSICTLPRCVNRRCIYERNPLRPGCCASATHPDLGCRDGNPCTPNICEPGAGTTELGTPYNACVFPIDTNGDGVDDCCEADADCDDGDPTTAERCRLDVGGTLSHTCERGPDPDYCGPEATTHDCDDGNPCTTDTCCDDVDEPLVGCGGAFRCLHTSQAGCCAFDSDCDDGEPCTRDRCCADAGSPVPECGGVGDCVHLPIQTCCHADADCEAAKPTESACDVAHCVGGRCVFGPDRISPECCAADADCDDRDRCTLEACVDGSCQSQGTIGPPECCHDRDDCPRDNDPCFTWTCWQQACVQFPLHDCCSLTDEGSSEVCDDGDPCTTDLCHAGRCRHGPDPDSPGCCAVAADCPPSGSPCASVACAADGGGCRAAGVAACVADLPFDEPFWLHPVYAGQVSLATLGWSQTGGSTPWRVEVAQPGRAARFSPARAEIGVDHCLVSPSIRTTGVTAATLQWRAAFADGSAVAEGIVTRVLAGTSGVPTEWDVVWDASDVGVDPPGASTGTRRWTATLPPAALGSTATRIAFCARVLPGAGDDASPWDLRRVVVAAGAPPTWDAAPESPVVVYSGNLRWFGLTVLDPGPVPDGSDAPPTLALRPDVAPAFVSYAVTRGATPDSWTAWIGLRPNDLDVMNKTPARLVATDGALETPFTLPIEVRSAFCGTSADCEDGDPCTVGACRDDSRCHVIQPPECRPR